MTHMDLTKTYLGIELGSTRIKAILIDYRHQVLASGTHQWENQLLDGHWTYSLTDAWQGIQAAFAQLATEVQTTYNLPLTTVGGMGISAMMHGYLAFDASDQLLTPFRTWRNTTTEQAAAKLTDKLGFNIPQRWSVAHLYQAMLNREAHVPYIHFLTTLAGYVHWQLTGEKVLGVGDASGMFPMAGDTYDEGMVRTFDSLGLGKGLQTLLPKVLVAGQSAGQLTPTGAQWLDPTGVFQPGVPLCPPEGDAGTGMVATNAITQRTGNISAGTSVFAMLVLEKPLSQVYTEVDMVTTPDGSPVAMVHCNNFTSDIDAWVKLLAENLALFGVIPTSSELYGKLYNLALTADTNWCGLLSYNYFAGEPITETDAGRPMFVRLPDARFDLANFMRTHLFAAMATLKLGMDILMTQEQVSLDHIQGHGGFFKTATVGQQLMAGALGVPVSVMETAGEGGAWGMAVLASYTQQGTGISLPDFLVTQVFTDVKASIITPKAEDVQAFDAFLTHYKQGLAIQRTAIVTMT